MASSRQIELAASRWLARRDAGMWGAHDQRQLDAWLEESIAHRVAYLRLAAAWQASDRLKALGAGRPAGVVPPRDSWGLAARRAGTNASPEDAGHVIPFRPTGTRTSAVRPRSVSYRSAWQLVGGALAASGVLVALGVVLHGRNDMAVEQASYRTPVGALQDVRLADGSVITLSSDSRIVVALSRRERRIDLQQGEAFFQVAKDPGRPFVVSTGDHRAVAVGTRYDVRRDAASLRVVVTQGLVRLESDATPAGRSQPTTLLPAGSVALATDGGVTVSMDPPTQMEALLGWRSGFLSFHDTPLATAVQEFNRYNARKIVIGDASIGSLRVGGNFRWSNADAFVRLLELGFPVRAVPGAGAIVLKKR